MIPTYDIEKFSKEMVPISTYANKLKYIFGDI